MSYRIVGRVQGVGFRYFIQERAQRLGVEGWIVNLPDGSVEALVQGKDMDVIRFEETLRKGPPGTEVHQFTGKEVSHDPMVRGFKIRRS